MKRLQLRDGSTVSVSDEDYPRFRDRRLSSYPNGTVYFRENGAVRFLHREIRGVRDSRVVRFLDGNRRNCTRGNLEVSDRKTVARTRRPHGVSPYKGVSPHKGRNWQATIREGDKLRHLGVFDSPIQAALAYDEAALRLHGLPEGLNFPPQRSARRRVAHSAATMR